MSNSSEELYPYANDEQIDTRLDVPNPETPDEIRDSSLIHSAEYFRSLGIDTQEKWNEFQKMNLNKPFSYPNTRDLYDLGSVTIEIPGDDGKVEDFKLVALDYIRIKSNSDEWSPPSPPANVIMAIALNPDLNKSSGRGTEFINTVPREWHKKILATIREKDPQFSTMAEAYFNAELAPEKEHKNWLTWVKSFIRSSK